MPWDIQPPLQICEDKQSICAGIQMFCHGENVDWMNKNCQKTCKKCPSGKTQLDRIIYCLPQLFFFNFYFLNLQETIAL